MSVGSLRIGRIFGIDISLHWTFILLLLIILVYQAYLAFVLFSLLFICVFIHELAHSVTSLRNGIRVREIVLTLLGGVSVIDNVEIDPKIEFRIAIVGPLMSLFLGGIFGIFAVFSPLGAITFLFQNLFILNIALGILNILPAFPMDGGRVFRSYLQRRMNSLEATLLTVKASKAVIGLLIVASFAYALFVNGNPLILTVNLIVALFLYEGAQTEQEGAIIRKKTSGLTVRGLATRGFISVDQDAGIKEIYRMVKDRRSHIVITKKEGSFMLVDFFRKKVNRGMRAADLSVPIPEIGPGSNVLDALIKIESSRPGVAAVVSKGRLLGVLTARHLEAFISLHMMNEKDGKDYKQKGAELDK